MTPFFRLRRLPALLVCLSLPTAGSCASRKFNAQAKTNDVAMPSETLRPLETFGIERGFSTHINPPRPLRFSLAHEVVKGEVFTMIVAGLCVYGDSASDKARGKCDENERRQPVEKVTAKMKELYFGTSTAMESVALTRPVEEALERLDTYLEHLDELAKQSDMTVERRAKIENAREDAKEERAGWLARRTLANAESEQREALRDPGVFDARWARLRERLAKDVTLTTVSDAEDQVLLSLAYAALIRMTDRQGNDAGSSYLWSRPVSEVKAGSRVFMTLNRRNDRVKGMSVNALKDRLLVLRQFTFDVPDKKGVVDDGPMWRMRDTVIDGAQACILSPDWKDVGDKAPRVFAPRYEMAGHSGSLTVWYAADLQEGQVESFTMECGKLLLDKSGWGFGARVYPTIESVGLKFEDVVSRKMVKEWLESDFEFSFDLPKGN